MTEFPVIKGIPAQSPLSASRPRPACTPGPSMKPAARAAYSAPRPAHWHARHGIPLSRRNNLVGGMRRVPSTRHKASAACSGAGTGRRVHSPFRFPFRILDSLPPVTARFVAALRSGECAARDSRSGSGRRADGEPDGNRRLGSSRAASWRSRRGMASVIERRDGDATREAAGVGVVRVLSPPRSRRVLPQLARGSRESRLRGAQSCACRVVPFTASDGRWCLAWNIAVYFGAFCGGDGNSGSTPFHSYAEAGCWPKQDVLKTALCIDHARSIHKLIPGSRSCLKFPSGDIAPKGAAGLARN